MPSRRLGGGGKAACRIHASRGPARRVGTGPGAPSRDGRGVDRGNGTDSTIHFAAHRESGRPAHASRARVAGARHEMNGRPRKLPEHLRSYRWFGRDDLRSWGHRSRARQAGFAREDMAGKPVIAILNTWSDANPCHTHFRLRADDVKRGVWQAGGFPMEIPLLTLGETFMKPSTMMYRNLLAMDAEEALRAYPAD